MGYTSRAKIAMLALAVIIFLLMIDIFTDTLILGLNPYFIAAVISIIIGLALFVIEFILFKNFGSDPLVRTGWLLEILTFLVGFSLIFGPIVKLTQNFFLYHKLLAMIFYIVVLVLVIRLFKTKK